MGAAVVMPFNSRRPKANRFWNASSSAEYIS
jgi:hypothetical protein